jgi:hypothetical protein
MAIISVENAAKAPTDLETVTTWMSYEISLIKEFQKHSKARQKKTVVVPNMRIDLCHKNYADVILA